MDARRWILIALGAAGLLLLADGYLAPVPLPAPPREGESAEARLASVTAAFAEPSLADDGRVSRFAGRAVELGGRPAAAVDLFDAERLALAAGVVAPADETYSALARGLVGGLPDWNGATICCVEELPGGRDVIAYVRHKGLPARWWLTESRGEVRAYDYEDCRVGIRLSELLAAGRDPATAESTAFALRQLAEPGADLGEALARAEAVPVRVLVRLAMATRALKRGEAAGTLKQADAAGAERPGMPAVDLLRAAAYARLGEADKAGAARRRAESVLGRGE